MESCSQTVAHLQVVQLLILCMIIMGDCIPTRSACQLALSFNKKQKIFSTCRNLGVQKASLAWSLFPQNHTLEIAFAGRAVSTSGWVGWGINLGSNPVMKGANTLIAFRAANGSNLLTYKLSDQTYNGVLPSCSSIDLVILDKAVEITGTNVKIFASFQLQPNQTVLNHIWNRGPGMDQFQPQAHDPTDIRGALRINMLQGTVLPVTPPHEKLKYIHGILNIVGWGFLLPIGAMTARYLRQFELEAGTAFWFYAHIILQTLGYVLGITGWAIGMKLGGYSKEVVSPQHRCIGITIFSFGSLQILSLLQRPNKNHKLRMYWNIYHHTLGYTIVLLAIINNFQGLHILKVNRLWRMGYTIALALGGAVAIVLEVMTWVVYMKRKSIYPTKILDRKYTSGGSCELIGKLDSISTDEFDKSRAFSWSVY